MGKKVEKTGENIFIKPTFFANVKGVFFVCLFAKISLAWKMDEIEVD